MKDSKLASLVLEAFLSGGSIEKGSPLGKILIKDFKRNMSLYVGWLREGSDTMIYLDDDNILKLNTNHNDIGIKLHRMFGVMIIRLWADKYYDSVITYINKSVDIGSRNINDRLYQTIRKYIFDNIEFNLVTNTEVTMLADILNNGLNFIKSSYQNNLDVIKAETAFRSPNTPDDPNDSDDGDDNNDGIDNDADNVGNVDNTDSESEITNTTDTVIDDTESNIESTISKDVLNKLKSNIKKEPIKVTPKAKEVIKKVKRKEKVAVQNDAIFTNDFVDYIKDKSDGAFSDDMLDKLRGVGIDDAKDKVTVRKMKKHLSDMMDKGHIALGTVDNDDVDSFRGERYPLTNGREAIVVDGEDIPIRFEKDKYVYIKESQNLNEFFGKATWNKLFNRDPNIKKMWRVLDKMGFSSEFISEVGEKVSNSNDFANLFLNNNHKKIADVLSKSLLSWTKNKLNNNSNLTKIYSNNGRIVSFMTNFINEIFEKPSLVNWLSNDMIELMKK